MFPIQYKLEVYCHIIQELMLLYFPVNLKHFLMDTCTQLAETKRLIFVCGLLPRAIFMITLYFYSKMEKIGTYAKCA